MIWQQSPTIIKTPLPFTINSGNILDFQEFVLLRGSGQSMTKNNKFFFHHHDHIKLKTLFNIVEDRFTNLLNFDVCVV